MEQLIPKPGLCLSQLGALLAKKGGFMATALEEWKKAQEKANAANEKRYNEAKGIYSGIASQYAPGGQFMSGALANYERQKLRDMSTANQSLVSSGLFNTTIAAGLPSKYEEEVGNPFRLNLEDIRMQRESEAKTNLAGLIERREDVAPDPSLFAQLMQGANSGVSIPSMSSMGGSSSGSSGGSSGGYSGGYSSGYNSGHSGGYSNQNWNNQQQQKTVINPIQATKMLANDVGKTLQPAYNSFENLYNKTGLSSVVSPIASMISNTPGASTLLKAMSPASNIFGAANFLKNAYSSITSALK